MSIKEELSQDRREYLKLQNLLPEAAISFKKEILEPLFRKCHYMCRAQKYLVITVIEQKLDRKDTKYYFYNGKKEKEKSFLKCISEDFFSFQDVCFDMKEILDAATEPSGDITGKKGDKIWNFFLTLDD